MNIKEIVIASHNIHKEKELRRNLKSAIRQIWTAKDFRLQEIEETGNSYEENAALKAETLMTVSRKPCLGDDSGIEVKALDNRPGLYSARYAETREKRIEKMLTEMHGKKNRKAQQICTLVFCHPSLEQIYTFTHAISGSIAKEPHGAGGFGYDSIFLVDKIKKTLAELTDQEKDKISHRGVACSNFVQWLEAFEIVAPNSKL